MKIAVQCDFDGTITEEDVSFLLLDTYIGQRWHKYLIEYMEGKIPVGTFNKRVFGMMKADRQTMTELVLNSERVKIRPGFHDMLDYCSQKDFKVVIVSNGLIFYIDAILQKLGVNDTEVHAAENYFSPDGMIVRYVGPDGTEMEVGYKEAYTESLQKRGYNIIYIGNGVSDVYPAHRSIHTFATAELLEKCREEDLKYTAFSDFHDIIRGLESLKLN